MLRKLVPSYLLIVLLLFIIALTLLSVAIADAGRAGPVTCQTVRFDGVALENPYCKLGRCAAGVTLLYDGTTYYASVTGWLLDAGQIVNVRAQVCNDGYAYRARIVR